MEEARVQAATLGEPVVRIAGHRSVERAVAVVHLFMETLGICVCIFSVGGCILVQYLYLCMRCHATLHDMT